MVDDGFCRTSARGIKMPMKLMVGCFPLLATSRPRHWIDSLRAGSGSKGLILVLDFAVKCVDCANGALGQLSSFCGSSCLSLWKSL